MRRRVLIIVPEKENIHGMFLAIYLNTPEGTKFEIREDFARADNEDFIISVVGVDSLIDGSRGNRFENMFIHIDSQIEEDIFDEIVVPTVCASDSEFPIVTFEWEDAERLIQHIVNMGQVAEKLYEQ